MLSLGSKNFVFMSELCPLQLGKIREARLLKLPRAQKSRPGESDKQIATNTIFSSFRLSKALSARVSVAIFALGLVDAGYSGDWSRIGAISKENEELLKLVAYVVVPFCIFVIFSISEETNTQN